MAVIRSRRKTALNHIDPALLIQLGPQQLAGGGIAFADPTPVIDHQYPAGHLIDQPPQPVRRPLFVAQALQFLLQRGDARSLAHGREIPYLRIFSTRVVRRTPNASAARATT